MLADKVVPALISDLDKKGIKNVKKSKWQLVFSYVPKKGDVGYIKGDISWIDAKEKPIRQALSIFANNQRHGAKFECYYKSHVSKGYWETEKTLGKSSWTMCLSIGSSEEKITRRSVG